MKNGLLQQEEVAAALMTGSGSAHFAVLQDPADAPALIARTQERYGEQLLGRMAQG